jgi:hypothetical protein
MKNLLMFLLIQFNSDILYAMDSSSPTVYLEGEYELKHIIKKEPSITIQKPKVRSWSDIKQVMADHTKSLSKLKVKDCSMIRDDLTMIGTYYQNILYADYQWVLYEDKQAKLCVELLQPDIGFLTETEAAVLLSASAGYHFEELGFWQEADIYAQQIAENVPGCNNLEAIVEDHSI